MDIKESRLYSFFCHCQEKGYTNMQDATQSLKAKVIATDLGIKYKDIAVTYAEAKEIYAAEQERLKNEELFQQSTGTLLFKLHGDEVVSVYLSENNDFYYTKNNNSLKYKGAPSFNLKNSTTISYTYHPPKATYTGVTVGGVHTGGINYTEAYMTGKSNSTSKGYIDVVDENLSFTLKFITFSNQIIDKFKRDKWVKENLKNGNTIYCYDPSKTSLKVSMLQSSVTQPGYYDKISAITSANDIDRLSMHECGKILDFLDSVLKGNFPLSDEELYAKALSLENTENSKELYESIKIFEKIHDYKDSSEHIEKIKIKLEPLIQQEKEQAVLEKEVRDAKVKRNLKIISIISAIIIIISIVLGTTIANNNKKAANESLYQTAMTYMEEQKYEEAMKSFNRLNGYNDSNDRIVECYNLWFEQGNIFFNDKKFIESTDCFQALNDTLSQENFTEITNEMCSKVDLSFKKSITHRNIQDGVGAIVEEYIDYFDRFGFKKLSGSEIEELIIGDWEITNDGFDNNLSNKRSFKNNGTTVTYYSINDKVISNDDSIYEIVDNSLVIHFMHDSEKIGSEKYEIYDLGDGYYLMHYDAIDCIMRKNNP